MDHVIINCAEGLLETIRGNCEQLGLPSQRIIRSWYPILEAERLQSTDAPLIIVYVQDCDSSTEERYIGCKKTISIAVGLVAKIDQISSNAIDSLVELFETLQNVLSAVDSFEYNERKYIITKRETAELNDPEQLESLIVLSRMNLEIEVYTE